MSDTVKLPPFLEEVVLAHTGATDSSTVTSRMRPADKLMRVEALKCFKASRLSFADMLCAKMLEERWQIRLLSGEVDDESAGRFVYRIDTGTHSFHYVARAYPWDGIEKVGRRADGANRDMFGALFVRLVSPERLEREFETFDVKAEGDMRSDADVIGWTPANRSSRHFDVVVDELAAGRQPDASLGLGYLMRNGGFQSSGRNGTISFQGIPADHPLNHPFFADILGIFLVRVFSIDLANAVARRRNPDAAQLAVENARTLGIGNSSGQGMCVALQRWPHWVATWVTVRETALAYAKSRPVDADTRNIMQNSILDAVSIYRRTDPQTEESVASNEAIAENLLRIRTWVAEDTAGQWEEFADRVAREMDGETLEQFHSLMLDLVPEFCEAVKPYFKIGAARQRVLQPDMTVAVLRDLLRRNYGWALAVDRTNSASHQHFWYHSVDNGEQRRGDRVTDPHEQFESFIDHVGIVQRLASVLTSRADDDTAGEVVFDHPDLHFAISRVQYLDGLPYAEIRDPIAHRDFLPSNLIRFFLACLGVRGTTPLSIRYVRGTFFQNLPLPQEFLDTETTFEKPELRSAG